MQRLTRHLEKRDGSPLASRPLPRTDYQPYKLSQRLSDEAVTAIMTAYQAGATTRKVGERFGLAHSSVEKLLRQHGIQTRRRSLGPDETQQAIELYEAGLSMRTIAEHLGAGASTIKRALVKAGVAIRPRFSKG